MATKSLNIDNIRYKRATAATWAAVDPILKEGEAGYDKTNKILKIGDGVNKWSLLPEAGKSPEVDDVSIVLNEYDELEVRGITIDGDNPRTLSFLPITKSAYNSLSVKDADTIYLITDDN